jgi:AcrR family transcriptional regulator
MTPAVHHRVRRGSAEDHADLRRRIVDAAFAIHARDGLEALSMRALAAEVGLSAMALYRYFASKTELLRALWEAVLVEATDEIGAAIAAQATPRAQLHASIEAFFDYWEAHPGHFRLVYMTPETMTTASEAALTDTNAYRRVVDLSLPVIRALIAEIGGDPARALIARDLRMSLMVGYLHARIVNTRFPWGDFGALREAAIGAIAQGVEQCVRSPQKRPAATPASASGTRKLQVASARESAAPRPPRPR